jgi:tetratricopeptide (TPR) repeat protein
MEISPANNRKLGFVRTFGYAVLFISLLNLECSYAEVYKWVDDKGRIQFSDRPKIGSIPDNQDVNKQPTYQNKKSDFRATNKTLHFSLQNIPDTGAYPKSIKLKIRKQFIQKKFSVLNRVLHRAQIASEENIEAENALYASYSAFRVPDISYETIFNQWVEDFPNTYQPYLARASYYYNMGWHSRGGKWANGTPKENIDLMKEYFIKSYGDLMKSIQLNDKSMISYSILIDILNTQGNDNEARIVTDKAIEMNPASYVVRSTYLMGLRPRWGGSYEEMTRFANDSLEHIDKNPKIQLLVGLILKDAADVARSNDHYELADEGYSKALEIGENSVVLMARGKNNISRKNYDLSIKDLDRAIELYPEDSDFYYYRSKAYRLSKKYEQAISDIKLAEQLAPMDKDIKTLKKILSDDLHRAGYDLYDQEKYDDAIVKYNLSINLDSTGANKYHNRAYSFIALGMLDKASKDFKRAIMLDPTEFRYVQSLDHHILSQQSEWDQIIVYWNNFLTFVPDSSRTYVELGGAYYHKGDFDKSLQNYKKAAEMGNLKGEKLHKDLRMKLIMTNQKKHISNHTNNGQEANSRK